MSSGMCSSSIILMWDYPNYSTYCLEKRGRHWPITWLYPTGSLNETNLTMQGRGRMPFFHNAFRSLWQADKKYSWMKLRNGSFKDFVPTHYPLGYLLVAYGREKYGDEFWKNVTQDAAAFKGLFYPFQKAIKKYSGKSYVQFRTDALNYSRD